MVNYGHTTTDYHTDKQTQPRSNQLKVGPLICSSPANVFLKLHTNMAKLSKELHEFHTGLGQLIQGPMSPQIINTV